MANLLNDSDLIAIKLLPGIGNNIIDKILSSDISSLRQFKEEHKKHKLGIKSVEKLEYELKNNIDEYLDKSFYIIEQCKEKNIKIISKTNKNYPVQLREINDSPSILYAKCKNEKNLNWEESIAIVGTRNATDKGTLWAYSAGKILTQKGFNIVSGLALGIDTAGHKGSIDAGIGQGITTAAITNVDQISPKSNIELSEKIIDHDGILVSENPPGTFFQKSQLIRRNRIQSGLSKGIFVVECGEKGGTLYTIDFAEKQGRSIYCPSLTEIIEESEQSFTIKKLTKEKKAQSVTLDQLKNFKFETTYNTKQKQLKLFS